MQRISSDPRMTRKLVSDGVFVEDKFILLDVGASGGVEQHWSVLSNQARFHAFEPVEAECTRLQALKNNLDITYHAVALGRCKERRPFYTNAIGVSLMSPPTEKTWSCLAKHDLWQQSRTRTIETTDLDSFLAQQNIVSANFLKTDTDGADLDVLLGARATLQRPELLGVCVEVFFLTGDAPHPPPFWQIDKYLRECGYAMYDLDVYRYSRKELPMPFEYDMIAQTISGQAVWGDALYFKDLRRQAQLETPLTLLKLACLFEIYGLPDCAAELILQRRDVLQKYSPDDLLDALTPALDGQPLSYREYLHQFETNTERFFPRRRSAATS